MGTLNSSAKKAWSEHSKRMRAFAVAGAVSAASLLGAAIYVLGADFIIGFINDRIVEVVGPLVPAVGQVIASYVFSFAAACGVIWFAASWGYWLAIRHPIPVAASQATQDPDNEKKAQRLAYHAADRIRDRIKLVDRIMQRGYRGDSERAALLEQHRPEILSNLLAIRKAGFIAPRLESIGTAEAAMLLKYVEEILPFIEKDLLEEARARAAQLTATSEAALEEISRKKT